MRAGDQMDDEISKRLDEGNRRRSEELYAPEVFQRVKEIQASMVKPAESYLDEAELGHLRCLIRLAVEFQHYLDQGSVLMAKGILRVPLIGALPAEFRQELQHASANPFNKYDLGYVCESILSGISSFWKLMAAYKSLDKTTNSGVAWDTVSTRESLKAQFISTFVKFTEEANFENKYRLLLDLFKLQMVFAGVLYDG